VSEILNGAFASIRMNPVATLGLAAVVLTIGTVITTLITLLVRHEAGIVRFPTRGQSLTTTQLHHLGFQAAAIIAPVVLGTAVLAILLETVLTCLLTAVVAEGTLGRKPTMGDAWRISRSRLWPVLGALLLIALGVIVVWVVLFVIVAVLAAAHAGGLAVLVGVLGGIAAFCLTVWTLVSTYLIPPVVVLERQGPIRAIRRSWGLVRRRFWRVFGTLLLASLIVALTSLVLQIPFSLLARVGGGAGELGGLVNGGSAVAVIITAIGSIVVGSVARPIGAGVVVLLYLDLRMRKEGFDLALQTAAGGAPSGDEFATLWRPPAPGRQPAPGNTVGTANWPGPGPAYPSQPYAGPPSGYPGQNYPGQNFPGQPRPGQPYQGQPAPGHPPYAGQFPAGPGQSPVATPPYPGTPQPGQPPAGQSPTTQSPTTQWAPPQPPPGSAPPSQSPGDQGASRASPGSTPGTSSQPATSQSPTTQWAPTQAPGSAPSGQPPADQGSWAAPGGETPGGSSQPPADQSPTTEWAPTESSPGSAPPSPPSAGQEPGATRDDQREGDQDPESGQAGSGPSGG
jgi:hypothetical protein